MIQALSLSAIFGVSIGLLICSVTRARSVREAMVLFMTLSAVIAAALIPLMT